MSNENQSKESETVSQGEWVISVKERTNLDLLELVCQLHYRALKYQSEDIHNAYVEARKELESRFPATPPSMPENKEIKSKEEILSQFDSNDEYPSYYHEGHVLQAMEAYASQFTPIEGKEKGFIEDAVNSYFHQAHEQLSRNDLGDIERKNWEGIKLKCESWFKRNTL